MLIFGTEGASQEAAVKKLRDQCGKRAQSWQDLSLSIWRGVDMVVRTNPLQPMPNICGTPTPLPRTPLFPPPTPLQTPDPSSHAAPHHASLPSALQVSSFPCLDTSTTSFSCLDTSTTSFSCLDTSTTSLQCLDTSTTSFSCLDTSTASFSCLDTSTTSLQIVQGGAAMAVGGDGPEPEGSKASSGSGSEQRRRVLSVSAGASHTAALLSGDLVCSWGRGEDGQLGHGDAEERHLPLIISALDECEISSITCGADHTTARSEATKSVYSWGWGDFGRLGHGNSSDLFIPRAIMGLNGLEIKQIACGDSHCLAITGDGEVHSWGRNQNGQLGLGHTDDVLVPNKVAAFEGIPVKMLAAGAEHTAAVTQSGKLYGWGWGRYGNLGLGDRNDRHVPGEVAAVPGEKMDLVACGWRHTLALSDSGKLYTFGWSKYGQLGHGDFEDHLVPFQVQALKHKRIQAISGGWRHSVALDEGGQLYGWGWNKFGQVGCGNTEDQNSPKLVTGMDNQKVAQVTCGWRHTVVITETGNVYSWGRGTSGQLGHGDAIDRSVPKRIELLSADGRACQGIESSPGGKRTTGSNWISPAERYAVVPDETMGPLTNRLHQTNYEEGELLVVPDQGRGADSETKRVRTGP